MPPLPVIANVFRCTINWQMAEGEPNPVNVMHFFDATAGGNTGAFAAVLDGSVNGDMFVTMKNTTTAPTCDVIPLNGTSPTSTHALINWTGAGGGGDVVPQMSGIITLKTSIRGPRGRGRVFLPGLLESSQTDGLVDAAIIATANPAWDDFLNAMAAADFPMVVASYTHTDNHAVLSATLRTRPGVIRQRQP